jgi:transposase
MNWTQSQYDRISHLLPRQRGNVEIENITFFRALQYITENGCKWRALPKHFGKWYTIYQRFRRWIDKGIFDRIEKELQMQVIDREKLTSLAMDSTYVKVHPNGTGAPKKKALKPSAKAAAGGRRKSTRSSRM